MLNCNIYRFDLLGHIYRFYNRILFSECRVPQRGSCIKLYGESNAMGSALNTWQMPQTARYPYITLIFH